MTTAERRRPDPKIGADEDGPLTCAECGDPLLAIERVFGGGRCRACRQLTADTRKKMPDETGEKE